MSPKALKGREAFNRVTLLVLFIATTYVGAVAGIYRGHSTFTSDQTRVHVWIIAAALTSVLITSRGIEKRLRGGYSTLTVWLKLNPEKVGEALGWNKAVAAGDGRQPGADVGVVDEDQ